MRKRALRVLLGTGYVVLLTALLFYQAGVFGARREWAVAVSGTLALGVALAVVLALYVRVSDRIAESGKKSKVEGASQQTGISTEGTLSTGDCEKHDRYVRNAAGDGGHASVCVGGKPTPPSSVALSAHCLAVMEGCGLSERELEVAWLLYRGYTNRQIGEELYIAESTVKKHVSHIYQKMNVYSRKEFRAMVQGGAR